MAIERRESASGLVETGRLQLAFCGHLIEKTALIETYHSENRIDGLADAVEGDIAMNEDDGGAGVIEIRIRETAQLFDSFDPSPFNERDLDRHAEDYIVSWARELPADRPLRIVVYLPAEAPRSAGEQGLPSAFANFFDNRAAALQRELRELFRIGWRYLSIGVPFLFICFGASQLVRTTLGPGAIVRALEESLIILGWVANWRPIEIFLYDWWPIKLRRDLYRRLRDARVVIERV